MEMPLPQSMQNEDNIFNYGFDKSLNRTAAEIQTSRDETEMMTRDILLQAGININTVNGISYSNGIQRRDYHWITVFDSLDGYGIAGSVGTSVIIVTGAIQLYCDNVSGHYAKVQKFIGFNGDIISWNKNSKVKFGFSFYGLGSNTLRIGRGGHDNSTDRKIGFIVSNFTLYGVTADGSNYTTIEYGVINDMSEYVLEYDHTANTSVEFFVNGVGFGTSYANIPSGTINASHAMMARLTTDENAEKYVYIGYWDFWQAK